MDKKKISTIIDQRMSRRINKIIGPSYGLLFTSELTLNKKSTMHNPRTATAILPEEGRG